MLFLAFIAYWNRMWKTGDRQLIYYMSAFIICIFGELAFTSYRSVFDTYDILGHIYKAAAFFLIFKGTFASSVNDPYVKLSDANEKLCMENAERLGAEEKLLRINRIYAVLSRTNHAIVHAADRDSLFREICNDAVEHGAFRMVWIGLVDEESKMVRPVAWSGTNDGYLDAISISVRDDPQGWGPTGSAIREGSLRIASDILGAPRSAPWHEEVRKRGYHSAAAISLKLNGKPIGALTMYAGEKNFFRWQLAELLQQMGMNISFALDNFDREARRRGYTFPGQSSKSA